MEELGLSSFVDIHNLKRSLHGLYPFVLLYHSGSSAMLASLTLGAAAVIIVGWICATFLMYMTFYIASKLLNSEEKSDSTK